MSPTNSIQGYKILPLVFSYQSTSCHEILIKESIKTEDYSKPFGRTLIILNVPPIATEVSLRNAFSTVGNIKQIIFEFNPKNKIDDGFKKAYIVFSKREYLLKALRLEKLKPLSSGSRPVQIGLDVWIEKYNKISDPDKLQEEINGYMENFNRLKNGKKEDVADDEGWTVVTKGGRKPGLSRNNNSSNKLNEKLQKVAKKRELTNFYTFQIRDSKMKNIASLRKNFEESKNKVQLMKQARKFKPY